MTTFGTVVPQASSVDAVKDGSVGSGSLLQLKVGEMIPWG